MDIYLTEDVSDTGERVNRFLPDGIAVNETAVVDEGVPKLAKDICAARYAVEVDAEELADRWDNGPAAGSRNERHQATVKSTTSMNGNRFRELEAAVQDHLGGPVDRASGAGPQLIKLSAYRSGGSTVLDYMCTMPSGKSLTVDDLLAPFAGETREFRIPPKTVRKALYVERDGEFLSPICKGVVRESS